MSNSHPFSVSVPISSLARHTAQQFSDEQVTFHKARRTFLNTLSVLVIHDYLSLMDIVTDLNQGDSWNPFMRHCADVADLVMPGIGRLECRPLLGSAEVCYVPPDAWWERIAYVFVQIDPSYTTATLLGFLFRVEQVEVSVYRLQTIDNLLTYLHQVRQYPPSVLAGKYVLLRDWLDGRYADSWLDMQSLMAEIKPFMFRWQCEAISLHSVTERPPEGISRGQFLHLGSRLIPLVMQLEVSSVHRFNLCVQIFPSGGSCSIPLGLTLTILDTTGKTVLHTQARHQDGILQLRFSGSMGEVFQVKVGLDEYWVTKTFMI